MLAFGPISNKFNRGDTGLEKVKQFLDYMWTHPDEEIQFQVLDMVLNVHLDASHLSSPIGSVPKDNQPILLHGEFYVLCTILKLVAASAAEAELVALFLNAKNTRIFQITLEELRHPQPLMPTHADNSITVGIVNSTIKRYKLRSMEMLYMWL